MYFILYSAFRIKSRRNLKKNKKWREFSRLTMWCPSVMRARQRACVPRLSADREAESVHRPSQRVRSVGERQGRAAECRKSACLRCREILKNSNQPPAMYFQWRSFVQSACNGRGRSFVQSACNGRGRSFVQSVCNGRGLELHSASLCRHFALNASLTFWY